MKLTSHRAISALAIILFLTCIAGIARAQAAWDTNVINITPATTCSTGEPISACPITGHRIEHSATSTGTFTVLTTTTGTTYSHTGVTAGQHCYRSIALSANGDAGPSNVVCKTNTRPAGPPNPDVLTVTSPVAFNVVPNLQRFTFERGERYAGRVRIGAACDERRTTGGGYYVIARLTAVTPRPASGTVLVAQCG